MKPLLLTFALLLALAGCSRHSDAFVQKLCKETKLSKLETLPDQDVTMFECRIGDISASSPLAAALRKAPKLVVGDDTLDLLQSNDPIRAVYVSSETHTEFSYYLKDDRLAATVLRSR